MTRRIRALARFLWEFVVGDDWRLAVGVVAGLALTALVADLGATAWWLLPVLAAAMLAASVWRASRFGG
jgi:large-conductance mechanosensitive channel